MITRKTWMLTALLLATACSDDDDSGAEPNDGGADARVTDAGNMDAGHDAVSIDAALLPDAGPGDAALDRGDAAAGAIAIVGSWADEVFGGDIEITPTRLGSQTIIEFDNVARTAITQNPADDAYEPSKFSKQVWTPVVDGSFYLCMQGYGYDTAAEAKATTMKLDATDPAKGGCGDNDFPWTHYVPAIELSGTWQSSGAAFVVDSKRFGDYSVRSYDNAKGTAVLASGGGDAGAATFSKLVWFKPSASSVYYCIVASALSTEQEAEDSMGTGDSSMPATGCNGGAWSSLSK